MAPRMMSGIEANDFWRDRRVFVTGCTGLVGGWTVRALLRRGAHVVGLIRDRVAGSLLFRDGTWWAFVVAAFFCSGLGLCIWGATRRFKRELKSRDGFLLVTLAWVLMAAVATIPMLIAMPHLSLTDAFFETTSGITTTGSTVLTHLEELPPAINLWRHALHWYGGMGIIVLALAILPLLGVTAHGESFFDGRIEHGLKRLDTMRTAEGGLAYWPGDPEEYLEELHSTRARELARYAAVIHMRTPSVAHGYMQSMLRVETAEEAARIDERILAAWADHPRRFVIDSDADFLRKLSLALEHVRDELPVCCRARDLHASDAA